ncbi:replication termination factor 2 [Parasteatoda tepidariorum]|uniref:replication termination factor 2 n=1 Tax=Parasteatoda tepidariorum TaxID=114398 RepID=UPI001C71B0ED|nr:replication termination factor 2 [Parasteatoda tepidariorum]
MGCDGGTIPRRDELVRQKKKPEQKDKNAENVAKWKHCAITQEPLRKPIVACELGKLYNKEAVIEHILNKEAAATSENAGHIARLADIKELNLTEKPGFEVNKNQKGDEYVDFHDSRYICPVTGLDMNGKQRFYLMWKCGCVLSERAVKEVKSDTCHKCGKPAAEDDLIILNGTDEETEVLREKMVERRRVAKLEKKKKKKASAAEGAPVEKKIKVETSEDSSSGYSSEDVRIKKEQEEGIDQKPGTSGVKTTKLINGVKAENKSRKDKETSKNVFLPDKAKKSYSIAKDPTASAAYKSLFTSSKAAKQQEKAHWVTHNPLYF